VDGVVSEGSQRAAGDGGLATSTYTSTIFSSVAVRAPGRDSGVGDAARYREGKLPSPDREPGDRLHRVNVEQLADRLLASGVDIGQLADFLALIDDPGFAVRSYPLVSAAGVP
jgi:hypothetical protein